jgi:hypothetical protein
MVSSPDGSSHRSGEASGSNLRPESLFGVEGLIAVVTGGGTGTLSFIHTAFYGADYLLFIDKASD